MRRPPEQPTPDALRSVSESRRKWIVSADRIAVLGSVRGAWPRTGRSSGRWMALHRSASDLRYRPAAGARRENWVHACGQLTGVGDRADMVAGFRAVTRYGFSYRTRRRDSGRALRARSQCPPKGRRSGAGVRRRRCAHRSGRCSVRSAGAAQDRGLSTPMDHPRSTTTTSTATRWCTARRHYGVSVRRT